MDDKPKDPNISDLLKRLTGQFKDVSIKTIQAPHRHPSDVEFFSKLLPEDPELKHLTIIRSKERIGKGAFVIDSFPDNSGKIAKLMDEKQLRGVLHISPMPFDYGFEMSDYPVPHVGIVPPENVHPFQRMSANLDAQNYLALMSGNLSPEEEALVKENLYPHQSEAFKKIQNASMFGKHVPKWPYGKSLILQPRDIEPMEVELVEPKKKKLPPSNLLAKLIKRI